MPALSGRREPPLGQFDEHEVVPRVEVVLAGLVDEPYAASLADGRRGALPISVRPERAAHSGPSGWDVHSSWSRGRVRVRCRRNAGYPRREPTLDRTAGWRTRGAGPRGRSADYRSCTRRPGAAACTPWPVL